MFGWLHCFRIRLSFRNAAAAKETAGLASLMSSTTPFRREMPRKAFACAGSPVIRLGSGSTEYGPILLTETRTV